MTEGVGIWALLLMAALATYLWRGLGVALSTRVQAGSALFQWVNCVSYAMLAGLVARMALLPIGSLTEVPLVDRVGAMTLAFVVFFVTRRSILPGVLAGVISLIIVTSIRAG